ncbi:EscT/YscT/HrcT family type III secretion system export apparatus protein [Escherichia coli]|nr:EscT/YscT/HrcT family type III secretion system export apparatus protein [Escherichia coli]EFJ5650159.1 EscT/YscT/HrcT family type III secretion system export apparatus protein [Escherichia coli]HAM9028509.1 EscT/YscT/HrcT family type III secretion system export apparatus protein [Escherichia coli]
MGEAILYQLHSLLAATALGFCRLAPTFYLLPFFASGNIPTVVRHPIIIVVSCALVQHYHYELSTLNEIDIALFAAREIIIGLFIACLLSSPFWIFLAIGSFIDNQRGATLSSTLDPATGVDTSELARLFNLFSAAVYLTNGGLNCRYDYVSFENIDEILRLLLWLEDVENAGQPVPDEQLSSEDKFIEGEEKEIENKDDNLKN